jgi:hypothetical protein
MYWNTVLGANRNTDDVLREFDLDPDDRKGIDEWLGQAEAEAWRVGGEKGELPKEWFEHHVRTIDHLSEMKVSRGKSKHSRRGKAKKTKQTMYGLPIYVVGDTNEEWAVGTEEQARKAAEKIIYESLFAFSPEFIAKELQIWSSTDPRQKKLIAAIRVMQEKCGEDVANAILYTMLAGAGSRQSFAKNAYQTDGLGHFLARYDGKEHSSDDIPGLPKGKLAYRTN